jgi:hypothetical protein
MEMESLGLKSTLTEEIVKHWLLLEKELRCAVERSEAEAIAYPRAFGGYVWKQSI